MAAPQQGNQSDNSMAILWGTAAAFAGIGLFWFAFKYYIATFYLHLKLFEANILSLFSETYFAPARASITSTLAISSKNLTYEQLIQAGASVGEILRYPLAGILIGLGLLLYFGNTARVFRRTYTMKDLVKLEKDNWPQIAPVANLDLLKTNIDVGPWAMAMSPMQFAKRFKLIEEVRPERQEGMTRKEWDKLEVVLKRGEANKVFAMQLGPLWKGIDKLPPYSKALFAAFAARINADSKAAQQLFAQLSASSTTKLDVTGTDELIKKYGSSTQVKEIINGHAYVYTVMAAMLAGAREDGVQASADFLWLKPVDRKLWYTLNTVGRQTPFAEVAGIFAHWVAEKEAGTRLLVPVVDEATKGLDIALKEVIYRPEKAAETNE